MDTTEPTIGTIPVDHESVHGSRLDPSSMEIRLLQILPKRSLAYDGPPTNDDIYTLEDTVHCTMFRTSLSSTIARPPSFNALSYVWGNPKEKTNIVINEAVVAVTCNLESALRHLRDHHNGATGGLPIWIDAVCINQDDIEERNQQVGSMGDIYRRAFRVFSWLGEGNEDTDWAIPLLNIGFPSWNNDFSTALEENPILAHPTQMRRMYGTLVFDLGSREYWHRLWILQEVMLARLTPIILCGSCSVSFNNFFHANAQFSIDFSRNPSEDTIDPDLYVFSEARDHLPYLSKSFGNPLVLILWAYIRTEICASGHIDLTTLISSGVLGSRATENHDHVYALRGLLAAEAQRLIPVNYASDPLRAYHHATVAMLSLPPSSSLASAPPSSAAQRILQSKGFGACLRYLSFNRSTDQSEVPSWVPDLSLKQEEDYSHEVREGRYFAKHTMTRGYFKIMIANISSNMKILRLHGIYFDEITATGRVTFQNSKRFPPIPLTSVLKEGLVHIKDLSGCISKRLANLRSKTPVQQKIAYTFFEWESLSTPDQDNEIWPKLMRELLKSPQDDIKRTKYRLIKAILKHLDKRKQGDEKDEASEVLWYIERFLETLYQRLHGHKAFVTRDGFFGLGPGHLASGDRVVFAFGMPCPFVVRPKDPDAFEHEYTMVGCAEIYELKYERSKFEEAVNNGDLETIQIKLV